MSAVLRSTRCLRRAATARPRTAGRWPGPCPASFAVRARRPPVEVAGMAAAAGTAAIDMVDVRLPSSDCSCSSRWLRPRSRSSRTARIAGYTLAGRVCPVHCRSGRGLIGPIWFRALARGAAHGANGVRGYARRAMVSGAAGWRRASAPLGCRGQRGASARARRAPAGWRRARGAQAARATSLGCWSTRR